MRKEGVQIYYIYQDCTDQIIGLYWKFLNNLSKVSTSLPS